MEVKQLLHHFKSVIRFLYLQVSVYIRFPFLILVSHWLQVDEILTNEEVVAMVEFCPVLAWL